jgi:hypothetical protein
MEVMEDWAAERTNGWGEKRAAGAWSGALPTVGCRWASAGRGGAMRPIGGER